MFLETPDDSFDKVIIINLKISIKIAVIRLGLMDLCLCRSSSEQQNAEPILIL